jgi:hypothetical protein
MVGASACPCGNYLVQLHLRSCALFFPNAMKMSRISLIDR